MNKRILAVFAFSCAVALATVSSAQNTPSEASIKQLLELAQVHKLLDGLFGQMDGYMKQAMQQATQGQRITIYRNGEFLHNGLRWWSRIRRQSFRRTSNERQRWDW